MLVFPAPYGVVERRKVLCAELGARFTGKRTDEGQFQSRGSKRRVLMAGKGGSTTVARFDQSFLVHMIKDFFVILLLVMVVEFSLKAALVYYDYWANGAEKAETVAEDLADNVRSIMLNEGGPVAARTLYPILRKNWSNLGYSIAVEPTPLTIEAIKEGFEFEPEGIPMGTWPQGQHQSAKVEIKAAEFCLSCHTTAGVGDTLGTVTVRSYLSTNFAKWWSDIQLTAGIAIGKIVLHSVLLFILLRARMEPLLRLRSTVAKLARAYAGLDQRAEIRSSDEFGLLSRDLNLFLDRISSLIAELDSVLRKVVTINDDVLKIQGDLRAKVASVSHKSRQIERAAMLNAKREPLLSTVWFEAAKGSVRELDAALSGLGDVPNAGPILENLRAVIANAESQIVTNENLFRDLADLGEDTEEFQTQITEMVRLEERMKGIIETGTVLVRRLRPSGKTT